MINGKGDKIANTVFDGCDKLSDVKVPSDVEGNEQTFGGKPINKDDMITGTCGENCNWYSEYAK